jgi:site-specific DNA recombinase
VESRATGVRGFIPCWLLGLNETANFVFPIPLKATPEPSLKIRQRDRDRAERIRLAGGRMMFLRERAVALALKTGIVKTKELTDVGVPRCYLTRMCDDGLLVRVGYVRYRAAAPRAA